MFFLNRFMLAGILCLLPCFASLLAQGREDASPIEYPNGIVAVVQDQIITLDDVNRRLLPYIQQLQAESASQAIFEEKLRKASKEILEDLISEKLLIYDFKVTKKGKIPESYASSSYQKLIQERFQGEREQLVSFLKMQNMTENQFKQKQEDDIILSFFQQQMRTTAPEISPQAVRNYYEAHKSEFTQNAATHLFQITLNPIKGDTAESTALKEKAYNIIKLLEEQRATNFAELAKLYSQDDLKTRGGDWGWIEEEDIHPELAKVVFSLKKGEFTREPILLNGYAFLLFVEDKREADYVPLETLREQIKERLLSEEVQKAKVKYIEDLRKKAYIKYYDL